METASPRGLSQRTAYAWLLARLFGRRQDDDLPVLAADLADVLDRTQPDNTGDAVVHKKLHKLEGGKQDEGQGAQ